MSTLHPIGERSVVIATPEEVALLGADGGVPPILADADDPSRLAVIAIPSASERWCGGLMEVLRYLHATSPRRVRLLLPANRLVTEISRRYYVPRVLDDGFRPLESLGSLATIATLPSSTPACKVLGADVLFTGDDGFVIDGTPIADVAPLEARRTAA